MSASNPKPGEGFRLADNPQEQVTVIEANGDEIRFERADGTKDTMPRSLFIRDYVVHESKVNRSS